METRNILGPKQCALWPESLPPTLGQTVNSYPEADDERERREGRAGDCEHSRMPVQVYEQVARVAVEQNRSASGQIRYWVERGLQREEAAA